MVEATLSVELREFKVLAEWARNLGARRLKIEHMEIEFYPNPAVFFDDRMDSLPPQDGTEEDRALAEQKARERRLFRSA